ncbi:MAG: transposase [Arcanobacterium sp.]|nr:transposase [Arcanobacterium sp.]MDY5588905.1 transposase [Arcanobacterium sp.]
MVSSIRKISESGLYHVWTRGVGKQLIFENDDDRQIFLRILRWALEHFGCELHAYCLMDNHVHVLVRAADGQLSAFMQQLQALYARAFNQAHEREGSLFQPRFGSEPVETDRYYLGVVRYILLNPEEAGISRHDSYPWSSYREYVPQRGVPPVVAVTATEFALSMFRSAEDFARFVRAGAKSAQSDPCSLGEPATGITPYRRMIDSEAILLVCKIAGVDSPGKIASFPRNKRDEILRQLKELGLQQSQLCRLTGVSRSTVSRA